MTAEDRPRMAVLADHIHGCPAGRPVGIMPLARRKALCDGCGKSKHCKIVTIYNIQEFVLIDLCSKCLDWFIEEAEE